MNQRIIYKTQEGNLIIVIPADCGLTVEEIATKDVPSGVQYFIVDV